MKIVTTAAMLLVLCFKQSTSFVPPSSSTHRPYGTAPLAASTNSHFSCPIPSAVIAGVTNAVEACEYGKVDASNQLLQRDTQKDDDLLKLNSYLFLEYTLKNNFGMSLLYYMNYIMNLNDETELKINLINEFLNQFYSIDHSSEFNLFDYPDIVTDTAFLNAFYNQLSPQQQDVFIKIIMTGKSEFGDLQLISDQWGGLDQYIINLIIKYQTRVALLGKTIHEVIAYLLKYYIPSNLNGKFKLSTVPQAYRLSGEYPEMITKIMDRTLTREAAMNLFKDFTDYSYRDLLEIVFTSRNNNINPQDLPTLLYNSKPGCSAIIHKLLKNRQLRVDLTPDLIRFAFKQYKMEDLIELEAIRSLQMYLHGYICENYKIKLLGKNTNELIELATALNYELGNFHLNHSKLRMEYQKILDAINGKLNHERQNKRKKKAKKPRK
eukprot:NODE_633_length_5187_cov_0.383844.p2 type:complete len:436 gc:universal NODE_633_length_5187_cov_0.383844:756-2063(+)